MIFSWILCLICKLCSDQFSLVKYTFDRYMIVLIFLTGKFLVLSLIFKITAESKSLPQKNLFQILIFKFADELT